MPQALATPPFDFGNAFFQANPNAREVIGLFEFLPAVLFYAKDCQHRYVAVNARTLTEVFGLESEQELLGKTDVDFQPPALAQAYHAEDRRVMDERRAIPNQLWLVPHVRGVPNWYVSTKTPLFDPAEQVVGIAGAMYPVSKPQQQRELFQELWPVIEYLDKHFTEVISMEQMAQKAGLSATHFNARFRAIMRMSPTEYVLSRRVQHARRLLSETSLSIIEIANDAGFCDQSHFTKRFRKAAGITPLQYRKRFRDRG